MPERPVVCDTGPLIALAMVEQLGLLHQLYPHVVVPEAVYREVMAGGLGRTGASQIASAEWLERTDVIVPEPLLSLELGPGEAAVLATGHHLQAQLVLIDERRARRIAEQAYRLRVKGSAGILVAAKRAGLIAAVRPLLDQMVRQGYYLSPQLLQRAALEAGEPPLS